VITEEFPPPLCASMLMYGDSPFPKNNYLQITNLLDLSVRGGGGEKREFKNKIPPIAKLSYTSMFLVWNIPPPRLRQRAKSWISSPKPVGFMKPDEIWFRLNRRLDRRSVYSYMDRLRRQGLPERNFNPRRGQLAYRVTARGKDRLAYLQEHLVKEF